MILLLLLLLMGVENKDFDDLVFFCELRAPIHQVEGLQSRWSNDARNSGSSYNKSLQRVSSFNPHGSCLEPGKRGEDQGAIGETFHNSMLLLRRLAKGCQGPSVAVP